MHRQHLKDKLSNYSPMDENEALMLIDIMEFVEKHRNCFDRELSVGHITGSAWIIDNDRTHALLTHHKKLDRWLQLGGHSDGDADTLAVALKEGREESGLVDINAISEGIFDVDVHLIPARKTEPDHFHYDIRFLLEADRNTPLIISEESNDLAWVALDDIEQLVDDQSILRMLRKTRELTTSC